MCAVAPATIDGSPFPAPDHVGCIEAHGCCPSAAAWVSSVRLRITPSASNVVRADRVRAPVPDSHHRTAATLGREHDVPGRLRLKKRLHLVRCRDARKFGDTGA